MRFCLGEADTFNMVYGVVSRVAFYLVVKDFVV